MNTVNIYLNESETENKNQNRIFIKRISGYNKNFGFFFVKRLFDVVVSFLGIIILFIPCILISLAIVIDSPGPALYKQERLGYCGKNFILYKFRSMTYDAEKNGAQWATANDCRCTKVGKFLRATRLDELPQLINILKGDMSIVGPRPERPVFYDKFSTYIDGFEQRLSVTPGLTGLAQINGGYELLPEEKILYDIEYIENQNFWLDLKIIFKTVLIVFNHKGAR